MISPTESHWLLLIDHKDLSANNKLITHQLFIDVTDATDVVDDISIPEK